eukprot:NODE_262_length_12566_cov_0.133392.p9 type:complete len:103 gc:universal NODE_262_length_12566_cov_0.133392:7419-7727(+)
MGILLQGSFRMISFGKRFLALPKDNVSTRILNLLKGFDKVDPLKVTVDAHLTKDLKLDSLDVTEVLMHVEEEFRVQIPDKVSDEVTSVKQIIEYISTRPDAI